MKALPRAALVSSPSPVDPSALPPEGEAYEHDHGCLVVGSMYCMLFFEAVGLLECQHTYVMKYTFYNTYYRKYYKH